MVAFLIFVFTTDAWLLLVRAAGGLYNTNATKLRVGDFAPPNVIAFDTAQRVFMTAYYVSLTYDFEPFTGVKRRVSCAHRIA
ncbi:MAG: hypothetical protein HRT63_00490 [Erythrobacter sp.]|nr:hypothetical protein [Erythrobacter sp.]